MTLADSVLNAKMLFLHPPESDGSASLRQLFSTLEVPQLESLTWPTTAAMLHTHSTVSLIVWQISAFEPAIVTACQQLRFLNSYAPVLMLGPELSEPAVLQLLEAGVTDYLVWSKDSSQTVLAARLRNYLQLANCDDHFQALQSTDLVYQTLIEQQPDLVVKLDCEGRFVYLNPACCQQFKRSETELMGQPWLSIVLPEDQDTVKHAWQQLCQRPYLAVVEHRLAVKDSQEHWIAWSGRAITDTEGNIQEVINVGRNITEAYHSEERIWQIMQSFGYMSRISSMGEMTSVMAHELNQPLTAILSFAQACQRVLEKPSYEVEDLQYALSRVVSNAELAAHIIRRIRQLVHRQSLSKSLISLNDLIIEMEQVVKRDLRRQAINLSLKLENNLPQMQLDYARIQQILLNLIYNSAEAIQAHHCEQREIIICTQLVNDNNVEVQIADTGPGISAELAEQLFEAFVTNKAQGLGIGLAVCRSLVEEHGGELWVEQHSQHGGACFHFTLPIEDKEIVCVN